MLFALPYGYSFDMYGIMGPIFLTKMARPRSKLGLVNSGNFLGRQPCLRLGSFKRPGSNF